MSLFVSRCRRLIPSTYKFPSQVRYNFVDRKFLSSGAPSNKEEDSPVKKQLIWGTAVAGGVVTLYGISTMLYSITSSLMTLTPMSSLYYGFVGGCITAAAGSSAFMTSGRLTSVHPDAAYHAAIKLLDADKAVSAVLGRRTTSSSQAIKAFRHTSGGLSVRDGRPTWVLPSLEMTVRVGGDKSDALAVMRVSRDQLLGAAAVKYLCVYFDNKQSAVSDVLLVGESKDDALKEALLRSFSL